jgi:CIC family chloride channel protein
LKRQLFQKNPASALLTTNEHTIMAVLGAIVGLIGGFGAIGFRYLLDVVQGVSYGSSGDLIRVVSSIPWHVRILIPAFGGFVVGPLVYFLARGRKAMGYPRSWKRSPLEAVSSENGLFLSNQ